MYRLKKLYVVISIILNKSCSPKVSQKFNILYLFVKLNGIITYLNWVKILSNIYFWFEIAILNIWKCNNILNLIIFKFIKHIF